MGRATPHISRRRRLGPHLSNCLRYASVGLSSARSYLLDSYLGIFSKQLIDGESLNSEKDLLLLVGLGMHMPCACALRMRMCPGRCPYDTPE